MNEELLKVKQIILDETPVFHHVIRLFDKNNMLIDKVKIKPEKSWDTYKNIHKMWFKAITKGK